MEHNLAQLRELLSNSGQIDVLFLDGVAHEVWYTRSKQDGSVYAIVIGEPWMVG